MFRSTTIIRELAIESGQSYIYVKTFGEITSLFIMRLCGSMSWTATGIYFRFSFQEMYGTVP